MRKIESGIQKLLLINIDLIAVLLGVHYAVNVNEYSLNNIIVAILGGEDDCISLILVAASRSILSGCQLALTDKYTTYTSSNLSEDNAPNVKAYFDDNDQITVLVVDVNRNITQW